jgi:hypothetical protein
LIQVKSNKRAATLENAYGGLVLQRAMWLLELSIGGSVAGRLSSVNPQL